MKTLPLVALITLITLPSCALAQTAPPPPNSGAGYGSDMGPSPNQQRPHVRFEDADTDHDGRLNRTEAQAMPFVARHFDEIDVDHDGYVTRAELRVARERFQAARAQRAGSQAGNAGAPTPPPGA